MRRLGIVAAFIIASAPALAQTAPAPAPASPSEQALGQKLISEINAGIACSTSNITLQRQLAEAQAELKRLQEQIEKKAQAK